MFTGLTSRGLTAFWGQHNVGPTHTVSVSCHRLLGTNLESRRRVNIITLPRIDSSLIRVMLYIICSAAHFFRDAFCCSDFCLVITVSWMFFCRVYFNTFCSSMSISAPVLYTFFFFFTLVRPTVLVFWTSSSFLHISSPFFGLIFLVFLINFSGC